ncbi:MAG: DnaD domain protein [Terrisporobacter othiniensis]|uniref:DnaD domain protein n=1 Tax=Terrisporobacter othiniensis TaxID=1577792 RepID=UPI00291263AA|nr:DnaD domain protein [Terrisporobacter othiniensis]MDU6984256.1 DnaD domain protein [Terrisporobacter othiniensis]
MERAFKGIWIPKEIWLSEDLNIMEKLFLVEIDSLDNDHGCFASNDYFSKFFKLSKNRCSEIIKSLEEKKYILISYKYIPGTKQIEKRILRVRNKYLGIRKTEGGVFEKSKGGTRKIDEVVGKSIRWSGNTEDNNTPLIIHINNTNIPTYENMSVDEKNSSMSKLYQENIGMINGIVAEWIKEISEKIDVELFKEALVICTDKGKLQFNFLKGIINNWLQKNVTSYEELKAFELQNRFTNSVSENNNNIQKTYKKGAGANVNNSFAGYAPDELEKILLESQKGKFD